MPFDRRGKVVGGVAQLRCGLHQQLKTLFQPAWEPLSEIRVVQQGEQGRRQPDGDLRLAIRIRVRLFQCLQQRQIALEQRLEEPVLLKRSRLSRADVGKVGVKNQGDCAFGQGTTQKVAEFSPYFRCEEVDPETRLGLINS